MKTRYNTIWLSGLICLKEPSTLPRKLHFPGAGRGGGSGLGPLLDEDCSSTSQLLLAGFPHANSWSAAVHLLAWLQADRDDLVIEKAMAQPWGYSSPKSPRVALETGHRLPPSLADVTRVWILARERCAPSSCVAARGPPSPEKLAHTPQGELSLSLFMPELVFPGSVKPHVLWPYM